MKILIPIISFGRAGGNRVLSQLANNWMTMGVSVDFLVDYRSPAPYFPTNANIIYFDGSGRLYDKEDLNSVRKNFKESNNSLNIYIGMWRALLKLKHNYDIILANHSLTTIPIFLAGASKAQKFYYIQAYEPEYYEIEKGLKSKILKHLSKISYALPFHKIVNAPIYLKYKKINSNLWIPPGIDNKIFFRRLSSPKISGNITLGIIGRKEISKGTIYALKAFEQLADKYPDIKLRIAYGNLPENWFHERAFISVPQNDSELASFYREIDILIAPGIVQLGACHYPVIEGMACGTPVVTTGYYPANQDNSWIVEVQNINQIVEAISEIILLQPTDLENYLDRAFDATKEFAWPEVAKKFLKQFNEFL